MYVTEAMISTLTEANNNAANFTREIKLMLETDARMHGLELDRRNSPWDMFDELQQHLATIAPDTLISQQQHMPTEADANMHHHDDGMEHSHDDGAEPHTHDAPPPHDAAPQSDGPMLDENGNGIDDMAEPKA